MKSKPRNGCLVKLSTKISETLPDDCDWVQMSDELWARNYRINVYSNSMYAYDGGLVFFVPNNNLDYSCHHPYMSLKSCHILVCNSF